MGMEGKLRQVSEFELAAYRNQPVNLYASIMSRYESPDIRQLTDRMNDLQSSPVLKRIQARAAAGLPPDPDDSAEYRAQMQAIIAENQDGFAALQATHIGLSKDGRELSLHKSWHCLHYLLTGKSWEPVDSALGKAIMGGQEIPDRQGVMGYGPVRYLTSREVSQIAQALDGFSIEERAAAFDPSAAEAAKVYVPNHGAEELMSYFSMLKDFYLDAAKNGNGMLLWVV